MGQCKKTRCVVCKKLYHARGFFIIVQFYGSYFMVYDMLVYCRTMNLLKLARFCLWSISYLLNGIYHNMGVSCLEFLLFPIVTLNML
jgi:hypothetical protein